MNILDQLGIVDIDKIATHEAKPKGDRILLYDGDGACYNPNIVNVAKLSTAFNRFEGDILEQMYRANCTSVRVHLTPKGCAKNNRGLLRTAKPYQEQRISKPKPRLLEPLRSGAPEHFAHHPDIQVFSHYDIEADDALMIDAFTFSNTVMISADKDLNINPFTDYKVDDGVFRKLKDGDLFGYIERLVWQTAGGNRASKVSGKGSKFFWAQMLMGDTADNVQGILKLNGKSCGEAGAFAALDPIKDEAECANYVIDAYRQIDQNVIAEAEAMWLLRNRQDSGLLYMQGLDLSPLNRQFIDSWVERGYRDEDYDEELIHEPT